MPNPVCWFEIYVEDMPRAKAFYQGLFQCTLEAVDAPDVEMCRFVPDAAAMGQYGATGALVKMAGLPETRGLNSLVYFATEDCGVAAERAVALGGHRVKPKMAIGANGFIALVNDTEGNVIGLHSIR